MGSVSLKCVQKIYPGGVAAVRGVDLEIADKEFIVFVGPSGCGKSTTLRMIAGLENITKGEIAIDGNVVNKIPPRKRDISMVFQSYALYPHMTVRKNMSFGLRMRRVPKREINRRVNEAAKLLDIEDLLDRKPSALSGGERQRVALGRAIVCEPAVFLMDEPLSNLDNKLRTQMRAELIRLHKRLNTTIIYVTHDQTEAMTMGDRIVVMKDGIIQQTGTPSELYIHPANTFVAGFIGSPQMNLLPVKLVRDGNHIAARFGRLSLLLSNKYDEAVIETYVGTNVLIGVRPENIYISPPGTIGIPMSLEMIESLGADLYLHMVDDSGECCLTMRCNSEQKIPENDEINICFDAEKVCLFDAVTGVAIKQSQ